MGKERDVFLTLQEVADRLGYAYITIYGWVKQKKIPCYKLGGYWKVKESELNEFIEKRKQVPVE